MFFETIKKSGKQKLNSALRYRIFPSCQRNINTTPHSPLLDKLAFDQIKPFQIPHHAQTRIKSIYLLSSSMSDFVEETSTVTMVSSIASSPLAEITIGDASPTPTTESLCWPSCYNCGRGLEPEIPPCFCPYCSAFNM